MVNVLLNPHEQDDYSEQDSGYSSHTPSETSELSYVSEQCSEIMTTEEAAQYIEEENNRFFAIRLAEYQARFGQFLYQYVDSVSQLQKKSFNKRILQKRIKKIKKANRQKARLEAKANRKN